jgi:hypothetical protein
MHTHAHRQTCLCVLLVCMFATPTALPLHCRCDADLIPDSAGKVGSVIADLLPVPGFLKK